MNVLLVGEIEPSLAKAVEAKYKALQLPNGATRTAFLAKHGASITAVVDGGPPGVDADLMKALPNLGAIVHHGVGYDTIDIDAARSLGIGVSNTPDVINDTVADTAVGLMLATMRGLCTADSFVRSGRWHLSGGYPLGRDLSGSRVGILGLGRIGLAIAQRLVGFDCAIAYHNRRRVPGTPFRYAASPVQLAEWVDVLVVATVGGPETKHLVNRAVLEALGPYGYVINIARGSVVGVEYDPMLAKISTWGATREEARTRMLAALRETVLLGVVTNRDYLRAVLAHPAFVAGATHTEFLAEHLAEWRPQRPAPERHRVAIAAAVALTSRAGGDAGARPAAPTPFATLGAWRGGGTGA